MVLIYPEPADGSFESEVTNSVTSYTQESGLVLGRRRGRLFLAGRRGER